jgi:hydroxypyruvate reductase
VKSLEPVEILRSAFDAAVEAAQPERCVRRFLPAPPRGRTVVIGAGKAAAAMALAVDQHWTADLTGIVVTAAGCEVACPRIEVIASSHPVPAAEGQRAAERILQEVSGLHADDLVICLISGGGSALMSLPAEGVSMEDKQAITRALLRCGATIGEINCVRRHLSRIKGGRLGVACYPAKLVTLAISDVPGDDPVDIASGPTVGDSTSCADALAVLDRFGIETPAYVRNGFQGGKWESVKPDDSRLSNSEFRIVAAPRQSLEAAARIAEANGIRPLILSDRIEGEARDVGRSMAAMAAQVVGRGEPVGPPCMLISGGETTVTVRGTGRGGRNVEFLLSFGLSLGPRDDVYAIAADTDGVDGMEPIAGALWRPDTLQRAAALGLDPQRHLDANDAHSFFQALGDSVVTGPTRTNVNDFRAILVLGDGPGRG